MAASKKTTGDPQAEDTGGQSGAGGIGGMFEGASGIVLKAAGILEKEIARGIIAAKQVEEKFVDVPKIRSGQVTNNQSVNELMVNAREIVHQLADILVDVVGITVQNVARLSTNMIKVTSEQTGSSRTAPQQVPLIQVPQELRAGESAEFPVMLENDHASEEKHIQFVSSLFSDAAGNQLPPDSLTFTPNPLIIPAASRGTVNVKIAIPATAQPGSYTSFVQGRDTESLKATLMVKVIP